MLVLQEILVHSNWPLPGKVNAVLGPAPFAQILPWGWWRWIAHNWLAYLADALAHVLHPVLMDVFSAWKSFTSRIPLFFFIMTNIRLLYLDQDGWTTPSFNHSETYFLTSSQWASGILNCFTQMGSLVLRVHQCAAAPQVKLVLHDGEKSLLNIFQGTRRHKLLLLPRLTTRCFHLWPQYFFFGRLDIS